MALKKIYTEEELELYETIVNFSEDAIITKTLDGIVTSWNSTAEQLFGYSYDEIIGKHISVIIPANRINEESEIIGKIRAGELVRHYETERLKKDGSIVFISLTVSPLKNSSGTITGASIIARDITRQRREQQHSKLLESVITNTTDAILITDASPLQLPGPRIVYANAAFTKMTGYSFEEIVGETPRILQGPKSDNVELARLSKAMHEKSPCELTIINYKKNGEEFWNNFIVNPIIDEKGKCTHFVSIERDITATKNEDVRNYFISEISKVFNGNSGFHESLDKFLSKLVGFGDYSLAELWLIDTEKKQLTLTSKIASIPETELFFSESAKKKSLTKGIGLPGIVWETRKSQFWDDISEPEHFVRREAAKIAGVRSIYGIPIFSNKEVTGVLILGLTVSEIENVAFMDTLEGIGVVLGNEIVRKQLDEELNKIFTFTPDVLCTVSADGYFKKVNPAMSRILGYSEEELLATPFLSLVHVEDRQKTLAELGRILEGRPTYYIENRYITKSGQVKWLAWTTTGASAEGIIYCSAKDITEKKDLEVLITKATGIARMGGWEIDMLSGDIYWSVMVRQILEVRADVQPDLENAIRFYKEGESREIITRVIKDATEFGKPWDVELQIITAKGNTKWVRVIGEAEFVGDKCIRILGSFQEIDGRKKAEFAEKKALEERNLILESIDDAFFAVDKNWKVTYWNRKAEAVLGRSKSEVLDHNLWEVYADSTESNAYKMYQHAMDTFYATNFEDYSQRLNKWYEISIYPSLEGLSVYFKDVTDRKSTEIELKKLHQSLIKQARELEISNAELEQFAFVASHDLQEPLRMVTSFMTQLEKKYGDLIDDTGKKYIYFAVDGAKRMRQIILDLLEFSRVGRMEERQEEIDLTQLVNDMLPLLRKNIEESRAVITLGKLPTVTINRTPISQVFQNLLGNAIKYRREGVAPQINIACEDGGNYWHFTVCDNGIGINVEYFEKIFIIFQRLHTREQYSGTGIGLAITKKIIETLHGKIWVTSEEGAGTTFHFTLPKK